MLQQYKFDLLIVDIVMPEKAVLEFLSRLRHENAVPVILLRRRWAETGDRIGRFGKAASDDYCGPAFLNPKKIGSAGSQDYFASFSSGERKTETRLNLRVMPL